MAYDAGSIDARMTLDRSAFQRGLRESRAEADQFSGKRVEAHLGVSGEAKTREELAMINRELSKIDHRRVAPNIDTTGLSRIASQASRARAPIGLLAASILTLGPALVPLGAAALGGIGLLGTMFGAAAAGAGAFALVAIPTIKSVITQTQAVHKAQLAYNNAVTDKQRQAALLKEKQAWAAMTPAQQAAGHALLAFKATFESFRASLQKPVLQVFTGGLNLARQILPSLRPLVQAASHAFVGLERGASRALAGPFWQKFMRFLSGQAGPAITTFGRVLGNLAHGFAGLAMAFKPLIGPFEQGLLHLTQRFAKFGETAGHNAGFKSFISYLRTNGPLVMRTLGDIAKLAGDLIKAFAPVGATILRHVDSVVRFAHAFAKAHPAIVRFVASMAPLVAIVLRLGAPVLRLVGLLGRLGPVVRVVGVAMRFLLGPIGLAVAAIGAVVGAAIYAYKHFKPFRDTVQQVARMFSSVLGPAVRQAAAWIKEHLGSAVSWVKAHWPEISKTIMGVMRTIADVIKTVLDVVKTLWHTYGGAIKQMVVGVWTAIKGIVTGVMHAIKGVIDIVLGLIHGNWGRVWKGIKEILHGVWEAIKGIVKGAFHIVLGIIKGVLSTIGTVFDAGWKLLKKIVHDAWEGIKKGVSDGISAVIRFVGQLPGKIIGALGDVGSLLFKAGKAIMEGLWNGLKSLAGHVLGWFDGFSGELASTARRKAKIHSPSQVFHEIGGHMMKGLANGLNAGGPGALRALASVMDGLQAGMNDPLKMRVAVGVTAGGSAAAGSTPAGARILTSAATGARLGGAFRAAPSIDRSTHHYEIKVPPAVSGQQGFDPHHAAAQLGRALVQHGRRR